METGKHKEFTFLAKLKAAQRELAMRKNAYPRWVTSGKMHADNAAYEIAVMQAIVDDYQRAVDRNANKEKTADETTVDQYQVRA